MKTTYKVGEMVASILSGCITAPTVERICEAYPDTLGCTGAPTPTSPSSPPTPTPVVPLTSSPTPSYGPTPEVDRDGDGYPVSEDCDDGDPMVNPGET